MILERGDVIDRVDLTLALILYYFVLFTAVYQLIFNFLFFVFSYLDMTIFIMLDRNLGRSKGYGLPRTRALLLA